MPYKLLFTYLSCVLLLLTGCKNSLKEQQDQVYSRHLQRHVKLSVISTPMPPDKSDMNLLLFNNAGDFEKMNAEKIIDSLNRRNLIEPLILVVIEGKENEEFGMSDLELPGKTGSKANKYQQFVINELYPFIKKKSVIRKFKSIAICGNSLGGISAFDIAWENADKINKVGIFSGDFNYTNRNDTISAALENIRASRKRPRLQYWFYAGGKPGSQVLANTKLLAQIIARKNLTGDIQVIEDNEGKNDHRSWRNHFPEFLLWAFGK